MKLSLRILSVLFCILAISTLVNAQSVKFFKTDLHRSDILKDEMSEEEAERVNHFKAFYNSRGRLVKVEFYPNGDRILAEMRKREIFPRPRAPFKYFRMWNPHKRELGEELPASKLGSLPYYRVSYDGESAIRTVEFFRKRNLRLWTYFLMKQEGETESHLSIVFASQQPLTILDPHLFHTSASEMKQGWIADFRHNRLNRPLETVVSDPIGNRYYFYRFKHRYETEGDSLNPVSFRYTTSEYYLADSTKMGSHQLIYDESERLLKKEFYDNRNQLLETIEYIFDTERNELVTVIRDPKGGILHRKVRKRK
tara:strand:- start:9168 stop:10100 length:933 start_codon:yes stop_codon:yes gene_type:complete